MLESVGRKFQFKELTPEEKEKRGILGRLWGSCANFLVPTRNGRMYSDKLWEKVFQDDLVKELIANGGIPGELDHPADRSETDSTKIAIMMPEAPKKDENGDLIAYFDILDTPCGKIAYQLAKYGFNLGISSRGDGEVNEEYDGTEQVDPETYSFNAFDLVLIPAVKSARLKMVEGLDTKTHEFRKALRESLESSSKEDREIMEKTLSDLNIDYSSEKTDNKEVTDDLAANDIESQMLKQLQEKIQKENEYKLQVKGLQEKLSVCNAKEAKLKEELQRYKSSVISLSDRAKDVKGMRTQIEQLKEEVEKYRQAEQMEKSRRISLTESQKSTVVKYDSLKESLKREREINSQISSEMKTLQESYDDYKTNTESQMHSLKESIEDLKRSSAIKSKEFQGKIEKATQIVEKYQKIAKTAMNKYIESKALVIGVKPSDIQNKLGKTYSFSDIDTICESLKDYRVNLSKLPFNLSSGDTRISITESKKETIKPKFDDVDEVDDQLRELCNMKG